MDISKLQHTRDLEMFQEVFTGAHTEELYWSSKHVGPFLHCVKIAQGGMPLCPCFFLLNHYDRLNALHIERREALRSSYFFLAL